MRTLISFIMLSLIAVTLQGCGGESGEGSAVDAGATALVTKVVVIDDSNYDANFLSMVVQPKSNQSIMDFIIPQALAALFVDMKPDFAPYYSKYYIPDSKYDCQSFVNLTGNMSYNSRWCDSTSLTTASANLDTDSARFALLDSLTISPRIATNLSVTDENPSPRIDSVSIANLVQDKYYHFTVSRLGGGVFYNPAVTIELVKTTNATATEFEAASEAHCGLSMVNSTESKALGDVVVKTADNLAVNDGGNYYDADLNIGGDDGIGDCYFKIYGSFAGVTIPSGYSKMIRIGKILVNETNNYPAIETVSFNGSSVTESEVAIDYEDFIERLDNSGTTYKYGTWDITQAGSGVTAIKESFWQFTCGGGGSEGGKWLTQEVVPSGSYTEILNNKYHTKAYADYYDVDADNDVDTDDGNVTDVKKFYWRVGGCAEMLMMVSVKDANNNLVQKKIAIVAQ